MFIVSTNGTLPSSGDELPVHRSTGRHSHADKCWFVISIKLKWLKLGGKYFDNRN